MGAATALDRFLPAVPSLILPEIAALALAPILVLTQPIGEAVEIDVGAASVLAQKTLAHGILTGTHIIEERRRSSRDVGFRLPRDLESVVISAALPVVDRDHGGVIVHAAGLLCQLDAVPARGLANLKAAHEIVG